MKKNYLFSIAIFLFYCITLNAQGPVYDWAKGIGSSGSLIERGKSIVTDASGNVYVAGDFQGTCDFDPGAGILNLTSNGNYDMFFAKYSSVGTLIWAKAIGGSQIDECDKIILDASSNVYICGSYMGTVDFDPNAGITNLSNSGSFDGFFAKYTSSGNIVWAKKISGISDDNINGIAVDLSGSVYIVGNFFSTTDADPGAGVQNLTSSGNSDVFFGKYDLNGNYIWAKSIGAAGAYADEAFDIILDNSGNCYFTGVFSGTVDFDAGAGASFLTVTGAEDIFLTSYSNSGNFIWADKIGGGGLEGYQGVDIKIDISNNLYIAGSFQSTVDFDPSASVFNLVSAGNDDCFLAKYDNGGNFIYAKRIGSTGTDFCEGLAIDPTGEAYITGFFELTVDFDPSGGVVNLTSAGNNDIFFAKYDAFGNYIWAAKIGDIGGDTGHGIYSDGNACYLTGKYNQFVDFDPGVGVVILPPGSNDDIFIAKYSICSGSPTTPGTISGTATICSGTTNTYSITAVAGATSYTWSLPGGWTGTSTTNSINATASSTSGNITVTANNACGNSTAQTLAVVVNTIPSTPGTISGTATICSGTTNTYSITAVAGATSYTWTLPGGWTGTSTTNSINATASSTSGNITVTANNACGNSTAQTLAITVNTIPSTPGTISGTATICSGTTNTYSITAVAGATSYTWSLPGGWTGTSTTNSINATASATSGNITVTANNSCGNSSVQTLAVTVNSIPASPGTISGLASMCIGTGAQTYSITAVSGATSYTWTLPSGWSGTSTTNSIVATPGTSGGNITVTANNTCGNSSPQTLAVIINPLPVVTYSQSPSLVCVNATSVALGTVSPVGGTFTGTAVTGSTFNASTAGTGTFNITYTYTDGNGCVNSAISSIVVDPCTGVSQNSIDNEILIYPNPTNNFVTLSGVEGDAQIILYNTLGKIIFTQQITKDKIQIDLTKLNAGVYFIQIIQENNSTTKKIIKR